MVVGRQHLLVRELIFVFMVNLHIVGLKMSECARKKSFYTFVATVKFLQDPFLLQIRVVLCSAFFFLIFPGTFDLL